MHPLSFTPCRHQARTTQISEVPGDPRLWHLQDFDEETDTDLVAAHQVDDAEPIAIGKRSEECFEVEFTFSSAHNAGIISQKIHICLDEYVRLLLLFFYARRSERKRG